MIKGVKTASVEVFNNKPYKSFEDFKNDMERDKFMSAQEALDYGLIDEIITKRS